MTDKERLGEIKLKFNNTIDIMLYVPYEDVKFLIEQAERVQELEKRIENLNELTDMQHEQILIFHKQLNQLIRTNQRYKQALEFYAAEEHYKEKLICEAQYDADGICISNDEYAPPIIYFDSGETARQALVREE